MLGGGKVRLADLQADQWRQALSPSACLTLQLIEIHVQCRCIVLWCIVDMWFAKFHICLSSWYDTSQGGRHKWGPYTDVYRGVKVFILFLPRRRSSAPAPPTARC